MTHKDCIFCKIVQKEIPAKIIDENDDVIVFLSLQNHPLIVTKKHMENIYEMDTETGRHVMSMAIKIAKAVKKGLNADGVNLVQNNEEAAGQEVFHFHLHIKPRFKQDQVILHFPGEDIPEDKKMTTLDRIKSALD
jgi:histidine triad (HIT) family protein